VADQIDYATFYADEVMPYAIAMLPQQAQGLLGAADTK